MYSETGDVAEPTASNRTPMFIWLGVIGLVLLSLILTLGGNEGQRFLGVSVQFVPFAVLAALAYGAAKNSASALFAYLWLALLGIVVLLFSLFYTILGLVKDWDLLLKVSRNPTGYSSTEIAEAFRPGFAPALLLCLALLTLVAIVAATMLLRPVRVLLSRVMPIDPDSFVHKIALCILTLVTLSSIVPLIVLGGRPPLLEFLTTQNLEGFDISAKPQDIFYQLVWTLPAALVAAGWPVARSFRATLIRLGMVRPTTSQVGIGIALGLGLAIVATFLLDPAITWLWRTLGWTTTNTAVFGEMLKGVMNPVGAVLIGVTAGIGEEMAVRGLLQPRIGLIPSNLAFTAFHAFQYGPDALLSVFLIGLALGVIRSRSNTTTSAIVHGVYDFAVVMAAVIF